MSASSSPSSSPPSSPALGPVDSSPPSSPSIGPVATPPESPGPTDPYAGSNKWKLRPRQYDAQNRVKPLGFGSLPARTVDAHDPFNDASVGSSRTSAASPYMRLPPLRVPRNEPRQDASVPTAPHVDPYAASAHKGWTPPCREKKPLSRSASAASAYTAQSQATDESTDPPALSVSRSLSPTSQNDDIVLGDESPSLGFSPLDTEEQIWDKVLDRAVDKVDIEINLTNSPLLSNPLTYIPAEIADLNKIVVLGSKPSDATTTTPVRIERTFMRSTTLPAMPRRHTPFFERDTTRKRFKAGSTSLIRTATAAIHLEDPPPSKGEIKLFLSNNKIKSLPLELFRVSGLTVLALRSNQISVMPSQVSQLVNLRELSIPFNKLRWLPAEMLGMQPMTLTVTRNEWIQPPTPPDSSDGDAKPSARSRAHAEPTRTHVSPTTVHFTIPPLTELCLRTLCTPIAEVEREQGKGKGTVVELVYAVPFTSTDRVPPHILHTLRACVPGAVAQPAAAPSPAKRLRRALEPRAHVHALTRGAGDEGEGEEPFPGLSVCPSPVHRAHDGGWQGGRVPVYVHHAEERFTWEREVAGTDVKAECGGAGVPVRWRGCRRGCLDFLDPGEDGADSEDDDVGGRVPLEAGTGVEDGASSAAVAEVQIVHFSSRPLEFDFEDFE